MDEPGQKSSPGLACICWRCFFSTFINLLWGLYIFQLRFNPMFILKLKAVYWLNPIWKMKVNLRCSLRHQTSFHVTNFHTFSERLTETMAGSSPNTLPMQTREDVTSSGVQLESNWVNMNCKLVQRGHSFPLQNQEIRTVFRAALEVRTFKEMAFLGAEDMFPDGKSPVYPGCSIEWCGLLQFVSLVFVRRCYPAQSCYKISFAVCSSVWDSTAVDKSDVPHVCYATIHTQITQPRRWNHAKAARL